MSESGEEPAVSEGGQEPADAPRRAGFVALIGAPNAGKSTLVNTLVGAKVSIVTHKVQTTRSPVRGILVRGPAQIVLVDTPGIFAPRRRLDRAMVSSAWRGAKDADRVVLLVDAERGLTEDVRAIFAALEGPEASRALALNKIDRVPRETLLALAAEANALAPFDATFMISAARGDGVDALVDWMAAAMPEGPWLYPDDDLSDLPLRQLAAEITREKLTLRLHQELPYAAHVETERWLEEKGGVRIDQVIYVERDSQKKIVIGAGGATIKAISTAARKEIAGVLERKVHLFLFVKVRENWGDDPDRYRELGLEFPSS